MIIKLLVEGGEMKPGPAIAQKLGPLGMNIGKIIQDVNSATSNFKGLKVPVELDINAKNKTFIVHVSSPPVAELIKKELGIEKGSGEAKKLKAGNLAIEQIIKIAKIKQPNMLVRDLKKAVSSVIGTCVSLGILIENEEAKKIQKQLVEGKFDSDIKQEKDTASNDKLQELKKYFDDLKKKQEEILKKEEEAAAAEEAAKAAVAPATPAAGATGTAGEKTPAAKEEESKKPEEAKKKK